MTSGCGGPGAHRSGGLRTVLRGLAADGDGLRRKAIRGGAWLAAGDVIQLVAAAAKAIVLARLVSSYDFGLFGIGLVVIAWADRVAQTGVGTALIRQPGDAEPYLDSVWTTQLIRGGTVAVAMLAGAGLSAGVLGNAEAAPVVRALSVLFLLRSLSSPGALLLQRELDFRRFVLWSLCEVLVGLVSGLALGLVWGNVWALVGSLLAGEAARAAASYRFAPRRPRVALDMARLRELARFGRWVFLFELLRLVTLTVDSIAVGRLLGAQALGIYQMGSRLAFVATVEVRVLVRRVMLPAFARMATPESRGRAFLELLRVTVAAVVPLGAALTVFAEPLVEALLGPDWSSSADVVRVLVWCGVARALGGATLSLFQATGRPEAPVATAVVGGGILLGGLYPATRAYGAVGAAAVVTMGALVSHGAELLLVVRAIRPSAREVLGALRTGAVGGLLFLAAGATRALPYPPHWLSALSVAGLLYASLLVWDHRAHVGLVGRRSGP